MQDYINQANHNQEFHDKIHEAFPDQYFDWKTTILFYVSIHLLKALAQKLGKNIGSTHREIFKNTNPMTPKSDTTMAISGTAHGMYGSLFQYSRTARYDGMANPEDFEELRQADHEDAVKVLHNFRLYIESRLR